MLDTEPVATLTDEARFYGLLGQTIRARRELLGFTQGQVAEALGLSRTSVVNIERGRQRLIVFQLVRLASALRCEIVDIIPAVGQSNEDDLRRLLVGYRPSVVDWVTSQLKSGSEITK